MDVADRRDRMHELKQLIASGDVFKWADSFLNAAGFRG
jgi:hypothetical protein